MTILETAHFEGDHAAWVERNQDEIMAALGPEGLGILLLADYYPGARCEEFFRAVTRDAVAFEEAQTIHRVDKDPVRQNFRQRTYDLTSADDLEMAAARTVNDSQALVRSMGAVFPELQLWTPRTMRVNWYNERKLGDDPGIDPHRDPSTDVGVVVDDVIEGGGVFGLVDAQGNVIAKWDTPSGSRLIMRASGLFVSEDEIRPEHFAYPNIGDERMVAYIADNSGQRNPLADPRLYT